MNLSEALRISNLSLDLRILILPPFPPLLAPSVLTLTDFILCSDVLLGLDPNFVPDASARLDYDPTFMRTHEALFLAIVSELGFDKSLFLESGPAPDPKSEPIVIPDTDEMVLDPLDVPHFASSNYSPKESLPFPDSDSDDDVSASSSNASLKRKSETSESGPEPQRKKRRTSTPEKEAPSQKFGCCFCVGTFDSYPALEFHLFKYHHQPLPDESEEVSEKFKVKHMQKPATKKTYMCFFCDNVTLTASGRRKHMKKVHGYSKTQEREREREMQRNNVSVASESS